MRFARTYVLASLPLVLAVSAFAQQTAISTAQSSTQAITLLQKSLVALNGGQPITDVTLSGTARRVAGSDDESGTAVFRALASGAGRMDLALSSGQRTEIMNGTTAPPSGSWSGPDGVSHAMVFHNLLSEPAWFFPAFAIARRLSTSGYLATYVAHETHEGQAVEHISVSQRPPSQAPSFAPTFAHLTQIDFFLDSSSFLPAAIAFDIHPDNNALLDIPIEIRFSDYRSLNGIQVPFHILKYLNNGLILDFQAQTITPNSGLSASAFNAI